MSTSTSYAPEARPSSHWTYPDNVIKDQYVIKLPSVGYPIYKPPTEIVDWMQGILYLLKMDYKSDCGMYHMLQIYYRFLVELPGFDYMLLFNILTSGKRTQFAPRGMDAIIQDWKTLISSKISRPVISDMFPCSKEAELLVAMEHSTYNATIGGRVLDSKSPVDRLWFSQFNSISDLMFYCYACPNDFAMDLNLVQENGLAHFVRACAFPLASTFDVVVDLLTNERYMQKMSIHLPHNKNSGPFGKRSYGDSLVVIKKTHALIGVKENFELCFEQPIVLTTSFVFRDIQIRGTKNFVLFCSGDRGNSEILIQNVGFKHAGISIENFSSVKILNVQVTGAHVAWYIDKVRSVVVDAPFGLPNLIQNCTLGFMLSNIGNVRILQMGLKNVGLSFFCQALYRVEFSYLRIAAGYRLGMIRALLPITFNNIEFDAEFFTPDVISSVGCVQDGLCIRKFESHYTLNNRALVDAAIASDVIGSRIPIPGVDIQVIYPNPSVWGYFTFEQYLKHNTAPIDVLDDIPPPQVVLGNAQTSFLLNFFPLAPTPQSRPPSPPPSPPPAPPSPHPSILPQYMHVPQSAIPLGRDIGSPAGESAFYPFSSRQSSPCENCLDERFLKRARLTPF